MKLIKRIPETNYPANALNLFFNDEFLNWPLSMQQKKYAWLPAVNISESENSFTLDLAVPGMSKEDFRIEIKDNTLVVSSEEAKENVEKEENFSRKEFSYHSFRRSFTLPENKIQEEAIKAKYENGVLSISLPKKEEAKPQPVKMIEIS